MIRLGLGSEKEARKHVKRVNAHIKNVSKCLNVFCLVEYIQTFDPFPEIFPGNFLL